VLAPADGSGAADRPFILVAVLCLLALVTLRQDLAGGDTDPATLETAGRTLVAVKEWTFVLNPLGWWG
jgi:hypothetical protein